MDRTRTGNPHPHRAAASIPACACLALLVLTAFSCGRPAPPPAARTAPGEWRTFEGSGSASGRVQALRLGPGRTVSIVNLTGSLVLTGERGLGQGFRLESIGYSDSLKGGAGWCVWTDSRGDRVFSEFRGKAVGTGNRVVGTLLGGTGPYAGGVGEYEFEWQFVVHAEDGSIHGRVVGFRGRFRREPVPAPAPGRESFLGEGGGGRGIL